MRCENGRPLDKSNGSDLTGCQNRDDGGNSASQEIATQTSLVDSFYDKLSKSFESTGLSLLFNFRETSLDLYVFYQEVTERGGFHQVTKDGKWGEVASTLNSKSSVSMSPAQLYKLYAHLLYQFEQTYHYRTRAKVVVPSSSFAASLGHPCGAGDISSCSTGKPKQFDSSQLSVVLFGPEDCPTKKRKCSDNSDQLSTGDCPTNKRKCSDNSDQLSTGPKSPAQKPVVQTLPKNKVVKKDPNSPIGARSAYQMFLRRECDRLKKIHGETSGSKNIRNMATDEWRGLSESDRQPYVEESKKDKERFNREMAAYKEFKNTQTDSDYHVILPEESAAVLASELMKNAQPNECLSQTNWDDYCGPLDIPG